MKIKFSPVLVLLALIAGPAALLASPTNDRKIENAAKASYNFRTVLEDRVAVTADDGVVTLTGTVEDKYDRSLAADTVEDLPGVVSVDNRIEIKPTYAEHSDAWMAFKIRGLLLMKSDVSIANTQVAVDDGNVVLTGTADNPAQKELTEAYAKDVDGVKSVQNDIVVTDKSADATDATVGDKIDDASITGEVKYAVFSHSSTSALRTKVTTTDGVIVITGVADSDAEKSFVTKLAHDVRGAKSVTNNMTVKDLTAKN